MLGSGLSPAPYVVQGLLPHQGGGDSWLVYLKRPPSPLVPACAKPLRRRQGRGKGEGDIERLSFRQHLPWVVHLIGIESLLHLLHGSNVFRREDE